MNEFQNLKMLLVSMYSLKFHGIQVKKEIERIHIPLSCVYSNYPQNLLTLASMASHFQIYNYL